VTPTRVFILTVVTMTAFAGNSLLCRLALKQTSIDAASFTFTRIIAGAIVLWLIVEFRRRLMVDRTASPVVERPPNSPATPKPREGGSPVTRLPRRSLAKAGHSSLPQAGNWASAVALFAYAAAFSFAYISLSAGTGALLLFGAVQATMIIWGLRQGEQLRARQWVGLAFALGGLVALLFPGLSAPPLGGSILMLGAGIAWGIYSLRGQASGDPISKTAGNFLRAVPLAAVLSVAFLPWANLDRAGIGFAILSGAIASGVGYAIWYTALPSLRAASAATVQLSVPVLAAAGGILFLGESITLRLLFASVAVLGGITLVVIERWRAFAPVK
jgi:drug/metabolite transporter (DMT)-like permease